MSSKAKRDRRALHLNGAKCLLGDKCMSCGYDSHWEILEFHHITPRSQTGRLKMSDVVDYKWERVREEVLDDMLLLCPNCHREMHLNDKENNSLRFRSRWTDTKEDMGGGDEASGDSGDQGVLQFGRTTEVLK